MTAAAHRGRPVLAALALATLVAAQAAGEDNAFMPKGGRALLLGLVGTPVNQAELLEIVQARRTESEWSDFLAARKTALNPRETATLAAYLSVNAPVAGAAAQGSALASSLPPDGRDLAWSECQSCHSLFAGYLTHKRPVQGWRNLFLSPFHREMKMNAQAREEFARYSALNMPMKIDEVPPDLRF